MVGRHFGAIKLATLGVVAFLLLQSVPGLVRTVTNINALRSDEVSTGLTPAEVEAVQIADLEAWHDDAGPGYVLHLDADALERDLVAVSVTVRGYSEDGATLLATGTGWVYVAGGDRAMTVGRLTPVAGADPAAPVTLLSAEFDVSETMRANPRLLVEESIADDGASPVTVRVTITAAPLASTDAAVHVVVRDARRAIVATATQHVEGVAAEPQAVELTLDRLNELPAGYSLEVSAVPL